MFLLTFVNHILQKKNLARVTSLLFVSYSNCYVIIFGDNVLCNQQNMNVFASLIFLFSFCEHYISQFSTAMIINCLRRHFLSRRVPPPKTIGNTAAAAIFQALAINVARLRYCHLAEIPISPLLPHSKSVAYLMCEGAPLSKGHHCRPAAQTKSGAPDAPPVFTQNRRSPIFRTRQVKADFFTYISTYTYVLLCSGAKDIWIRILFFI